MSDSFYYRSEPKKWLVGMATLTPEERGVYRTLCDLMYDNGGFLADDNRAGLAHQNYCSTRKYNTIRLALLEKGKIVLVENYLTNKTVLKTLKPQFISRKSLVKSVLNSVESNDFSDLRGGNSQESIVNSQYTPKPPSGGCELLDEFLGAWPIPGQSMDRLNEAWALVGSDDDRRLIILAARDYAGRMQSGEKLSRWSAHKFITQEVYKTFGVSSGGNVVSLVDEFGIRKGA